MRKTLFFLTLLSAVCPLPAQDIAGALQSIEQNNKTLLALQKNREAAELDLKAANNPEALSIEYSPFFRRGTDGMASSELVVSQGFDFPTLYSARRKAARLQSEVLRQEYATARRDLLLQAESLCLDMVYQKSAAALLEKRRMNSGKLLALFEKRLQEGDATILEVNKIKMERMAVETEFAQLEAARQTTLHALLAMNGGEPYPFEQISEYPPLPPESEETLYEQYIASDPALLTARATLEASAQEVRISRQGWLPSLEIGFRRNTETGEASHGFLVGGSIPLFSNRGKVKAARARQQSARLQMENARTETENQARARILELQQLRASAAAYDLPLLHSTLDALEKAVEAGTLPLTDYYAEADAVYRNLQAALQAERDYRRALAQILGNRL